MYIKIWKYHCTPVAYTPGEAPEEPKCRPISWLALKADVFKWEIIPRASWEETAGEVVDDVILGLHPGVGEEVVELDEVCLLEVKAPFQHCVVFDTNAYICNDQGDTIESISPMRKAKVPV